MFARALTLPAAGTETFFLWGPRQTGKSTLLRQRFADAFWIDLLKADELRRYAVRPELLRQELEVAGPSPRQVVIDEVQKVPALLDEVHWLMENRGTPSVCAVRVLGKCGGVRQTSLADVRYGSSCLA